MSSKINGNPREANENDGAIYQSGEAALFHVATARRLITDYAVQLGTRESTPINRTVIREKFAEITMFIEHCTNVNARLT